MGFVKVVKNNAYYKRYQVKYRRRREGKTDYQARRRMVIQDNNKFASPRYRFVVRITNKCVITQVVHTKIIGDIVTCAAYSTELPEYGLKVGLTNWSAAYATGLLCARRLYAQLDTEVASREGRKAGSKNMEGLSDKFEGVVEADGEYYNAGELEEDDEEERKENNEPHAFYCVMDSGLARTNTGARIFGALKGAVDGGLNVPHEEKRFPGFDETEDDPEEAMETEVLNKYIYGGHVAEYMEDLEDEDPELFEKQFAKYAELGIGSGDVEEMYQGVHKAIREHPLPKKQNDGDYKELGKQFKKNKLSYQQKKAKIKQKIAYGLYTMENA
jgi:large subunit ribosomal protein L5e